MRVHPANAGVVGLCRGLRDYAIENLDRHNG